MFIHFSIYVIDMVGKREDAHEIFIRARIVTLWQEGKSITRIVDEVGVSRNRVRRWIRRYEAEGHVETRARPGRPKCTTREEDDRIVAMARRTPIVTAVHITRTLQLPCSFLTTRRRLREANLICRVPAVKEFLSAAQREARLGFALEYIAKGDEFWNNVIFTDEKVFSSVEANKRHCWRPDNTRYSSENIMEKKISGRKTTSFWGWMWCHGPGELVPITGKFNSVQYVEILEEVLLPTVRAMAIPAPLPITLVHDNSSIHSSRMVKEWLNGHPEIHIVNWPPKGCDLNPIEHLWAAMVRDWEVEGEQRTAAAVQLTAERVWENFRRNPGLCQKLVESLPRRINEVIDKHGGWTHY